MKLMDFVTKQQYQAMHAVANSVQASRAWMDHDHSAALLEDKQRQWGFAKLVDQKLNQQGVR